MSYSSEEKKNQNVGSGNGDNQEFTSDTNQRYRSSQKPELSAATQQQIETVKEVASAIKEYSIMARETSKALRESGAVPELVVAVRDIASVVRDIAADVRETSRELKDSGVTDEIASSVKETVASANDTIEIAKDTASSAKEKFQPGRQSPSTNKKLGSSPAGVE